MTAPNGVHVDVDGKRWGEVPGGGWRLLDVVSSNDDVSTNGNSAGVETVRRRTSWNAPDLLTAEFAEPAFAVPDLVPEGLAFMCGAPKLGKSWMALGLSIACSSDTGRALGQIPVEGGDVLYLALEDSPRRLQARLKLLLAGETPPARLQLETEWPRLGEGGTERLDGWLEDHPKARLVLIDVWPRIRPRLSKRTDYYTADYEAAAPLQALAITRGVAIVALYHTRKAEADDFVETVQGTFGTAAAADTIIVVKRSRGQADATLHVTGRDVQERELALRFAPDAGTWALLGDAAEFGLGETRKELLDAIRAHGSLTPKQAAEVTSVPYSTAKVTLWRMAQDDQLAATNGRYALRSPVTPVTGATQEASSSLSGNRVTAVTDLLTAFPGSEVADA